VLMSSVVFLTGCGVAPMSYESPLGAPPNYRSIIAENLRSPRSPPLRASQSANELFNESGNIFADPKEIGSVEIADTQRQVMSASLGWTWMTCIKAQVGKAYNTYAIFIVGNSIVDGRISVLADRCDDFHFQQLNWR
jgi:hypothetical protein